MPKDILYSLEVFSCFAFLPTCKLRVTNILTVTFFRLWIIPECQKGPHNDGQ